MVLTSQGVAVGKEKFYQDAKDVMELMVKAQSMLYSLNLFMYQVDTLNQTILKSLSCYKPGLEFAGEISMKFLLIV